jgi:predicted porin
MKKSLLAIAALTAFAGAAQAQSSVTVYGILDVGYIGANEKVSGGRATLKQTGNSFGQSAQSTSRLGFKGTEDLGGGKSAFFTVEVGLTPNDQQSISSGTTSNRQTFAGLKSNGLGQAAFGTQYTNLHNQVFATDPGQANNMMGNVIYATGSVPSSSYASAYNGNTDAYTVRTGNTLTLKSDKFAGFEGNLNYTWNNSSTTEAQVAAPNQGRTGGSNNRSGVQLGVNYTWNKLYATANWQAFKADQSYTATSAQVAAGGVGASVGAPAVFGTAVQTGTNIKDNQGYVAATYDFGILKAYAQWVTRKATSEINGNAYVKRQAQQIGVRASLTPTIEGWASVGNGKWTAFGNSNENQSFTGWQAGANYLLSKRTNLYAIYGGSNTSSGGLNGSYNGQNYAVGVRHSF